MHNIIAIIYFTTQMQYQVSQHKSPYIKSHHSNTPWNHEKTWFSTVFASNLYNHEVL